MPYCKHNRSEYKQDIKMMILDKVQVDPDPIAGGKDFCHARRYTLNYKNYNSDKMILWW